MRSSSIQGVERPWKETHCKVRRSICKCNSIYLNLFHEMESCAYSRMSCLDLTAEYVRMKTKAKAVGLHFLLSFHFLTLG